MDHEIFQNKALAKILLVDDDISSIEIVKHFLKNLNYEVSFVTSSNKALYLAKEIKPDLILLDIIMPEMDGYEVCTLLKNDEETDHIPIIFLSAKGESDDMVQGFELGAIDYIRKPFQHKELLARLKTHINLKLAQDQLVSYSADLISKNNELENALNQVKTLEGLLPICSYCKCLRKQDSDPDDQKSWIKIEEYIKTQMDLTFTKAICPDCNTLIFS